jgi:hypothetical protein
MVLQVRPQSAHTLDSSGSSCSSLGTHKPAFMRQGAGVSEKIDARASRTFRSPQEPHSRAVGFVRHTPVKALNKDALPGVINDIATQTFNSGRDFVGASAQWAHRYGPDAQQMIDLLAMSTVGAGAVIATGPSSTVPSSSELAIGSAGGALIWGGINAAFGRQHLLDDLVARFLPNPPPVQLLANLASIAG